MEDGIFDKGVEDMSKCYAAELAQCKEDQEAGTEVLRKALADYTGQIIKVVNNSYREDAPFVIYALETMAKVLRGRSPKAAEAADDILQEFSAEILDVGGIMGGGKRWR
jgi:hypothetical protein